VIESDTRPSRPSAEPVTGPNFAPASIFAVAGIPEMVTPLSGSSSVQLVNTSVKAVNKVLRA